MRKIIRRIKAWMFIHGIGRLPREYAQIKEPAQRMEFLYSNFGKRGLEVLQDRNFEIYYKVREAFE